MLQVDKEARRQEFERKLLLLSQVSVRIVNEERDDDRQRRIIVHPTGINDVLLEELLEHVLIVHVHLDHFTIALPRDIGHEAASWERHALFVELDTLLLSHLACLINRRLVFLQTPSAAALDRFFRYNVF